MSLQEGCEGTENRLILHILTRPLCLFILAVFSSILRCLVHSFILALAIPVFLLIVFLKITMPRSTGVLGSSRPYWDYVGSSYRGTQDETLQNPYCRISGKTPVTKRVSLLLCRKLLVFWVVFTCCSQIIVFLLLSQGAESHPKTRIKSRQRRR